MTLVNILTIVFLIIMVACYSLFVQTKKQVSMGVREKTNWLNLGILLMLGLIVRYILACIDKGYPVDMGCFSAWSDQVYQNGFSNFYTSEMFTDYPPGYMYILWVVGAFRDAIPSLADSTILVKMPAIICDLLTGALIYKVAHKRFDEKSCVVLSGIYMFHPVILMDSAMWGQVDSVFTLFLALMCCCIAEKKLILSYFIFAIGILMKPQMLVLTPVIGIGLLDQLFLNKIEKDKVKNVLVKLATVVGVAVVMLLAFVVAGKTSVIKEFINLDTPKYGWLAIPFVGFAVLYFICIDFKADFKRLKIVSKDAAKLTPKKKFAKFLEADICKVLVHMSSVYVAGGLAILSVVPYGLMPVWQQYQSTLDSYPYATVNAYNFWGMKGLNWHSQTETMMGITYQTWGSVFIVLLCALALALCIWNCKKEDGSKYFFYGALIVCGFFTMSVRVHERYMFPVFMLLLMAFLYRPKKEFLFAYMGLTICQANNIWHSYKFYNPENFDWEATFPKIIGFLHVLAFIYILYIAVKIYIIQRDKADDENVSQFFKSSFKKEGEEEKKKSITPTEKAPKFTKYDWIAMLAITIIYGAIALFNLGNAEAPETHWDRDAVGETITLDLSNRQGALTKMSYYLGRYENREFYLQQSTDMVNWTSVPVNGQDEATLAAEASKFTMVSVFCWGDASFYITAPYVRLVCNSGCTVINELVFFDEAGNKVLPVNSAEYTEMFDEQQLWPEISTFRDSTYFDEIYHGRTAYEMTQGVYCYENTHPPLGKYIISIGIRIFGMCPFGWRIMGTLVGIAMLPFFYLFTKRFFRETWIAAITTTLFAADFMHFSQTRIATIDVYVTFFIILMYYFMYQYTRLSFYDTPLKKTFIPLLCSGISMGLGCASKWPGAYAGIGLAIIFFITLARRYMEYRYALLVPSSSTEGISHKEVIKTFKSKTIKTLAFCLLAFVAIPFTIYTMSYIPFSDGNELGLISYVTDTQPNADGVHTISTVPLENGEMLTLDTSYTKVAIKSELEDPDSFTGKLAIKWNGCGLNRLLGRMVRNQVTMFNYHSDLEATHPYSSKFYEWPTITRPIWYYTKTVSENKQENISAMGNPLVWWAGIPAFVYMLYLVWKKKDVKALFLSVSYLAQYVPWMSISRCTFIYHYFPSVPFITIMTGYGMYQFCNRNKKKHFKMSRKICIGYAVAAVALFALFYPVLSGYPIDVSYGLKYLRWFEKWVLVSG